MTETKHKEAPILHTKSGEIEVRKLSEAAHKAVNPHSKGHKEVVVAHSAAWKKLANK